MSAQEEIPTRPPDGKERGMETCTVSAVFNNLVGVLALAAATVIGYLVYSNWFRG